MKNSKLFLFLFSIGLICLAVSGLSLFLSLNPSLLKPLVQYEIGSLKSYDGNVVRLLDLSKREPVSKGQKIYSKERFLIGEDSSASFKLSNETISITGPADFSLEVISPETQKVFVNFSTFQEINPKRSFKKLILTYKGWVIEPYFKKADLEDPISQDITAAPISDTEIETSNLSNKESLLDELIAGKRSLLKRCYENYLRKNPLATGKLVVEFTLQNTGKVSSSKIKDSSFFKDETFKNCVQDVFKRIKTSAFDGESILVTYPIEFE